MVTLCTLDSAEDAALFQAKLEFQTIPATIVPVNTGLINNVPVNANADEDPDDSTDLFEVHVRRDDLLRATYLLDAWMAEELEDAADNDIDDVDLDDVDLKIDDASDPDLPIDARDTAGAAAHELDTAQRTTTPFR